MIQQGAVIGDLSKGVRAGRTPVSARKKLAKTKTRKSSPIETHPKVPFSFRRNVLPPLAGVVVMAGILGAINGQWLAAQLQYRLHQPAAAAASGPQSTVAPAAVVDDTKSPDPSAGPQVVIPSINVTAPVVSEPGTAEWQVQLALRRGVVRYATSAEPGQPGNVVLFGHSSGQPWAPGDYKFVFTLLDKLKPGDTVQLDSDGTRYTYQVTGSQVVLPDQISVLEHTADPTLTLITCTPVGSSAKRLVVSAKLIRPLPNAPQAATAAAPVPAPAAAATETPQALPASASSSFWQTILSWF